MHFSVIHHKFFCILAYFQLLFVSLCNYVVCDKSRAVELIQVAYEIDSPRAYDREVSSLIKASDALSCNQLTLIAFTQTRDVEINGKTIHIISAIEWLLGYGTAIRQ